MHCTVYLELYLKRDGIKVSCIFSLSAILSDSSPALWSQDEVYEWMRVLAVNHYCRDVVSLSHTPPSPTDVTASKGSSLFFFDHQFSPRLPLHTRLPSLNFQEILNLTPRSLYQYRFQGPFTTKVRVYVHRKPQDLR